MLRSRVFVLVVFVVLQELQQVLNSVGIICLEAFVGAGVLRTVGNTGGGGRRRHNGHSVTAIFGLLVVRSILWYRCCCRGVCFALWFEERSNHYIRDERAVVSFAVYLY